MSAGSFDVEPGIAKFSGVVKSDSLITNSYTPVLFSLNTCCFMELQTVNKIGTTTPGIRLISYSCIRHFRISFPLSFNSNCFFSKWHFRHFLLPVFAHFCSNIAVLAVLPFGVRTSFSA